MKYYLSNTVYGLSVRVIGPSEEEETRVCILAENLFNCKVLDDPENTVFYLDNLKQFKRLIKWKCLFDLCDVNKPFHFKMLACRSLGIAKQIFLNNVFENPWGSDLLKRDARSYQF